MPAALHGPGLFLRSRSAKWTLLALLGTTTLGLLIGKATLRILNGSGQGVPWAVLVPCVFAVIISIGQHTEMVQAEQLAGRWIGAYRATYLTAVTALALLATYSIAAAVPGPIGAPAAVRNLLALEGVALMCSWVLEYRLTWMAPAVWTFMAMSFGAGPNGNAKWWALPIMPNNAWNAAYLAAATFAVGLAMAANRASRGNGSG